MMPQVDSGSRKRTPAKGRAFVKGGVGCLGTFIALGLLVLTLGGTMQLDIGGAIMLFVIGGLIGLIVNAIYQRGKRDAARPEDNQAPE